MPAQLDRASIGFWTLEQPFAAVDLSLNYLRIGTLDGKVTRSVELHNPGNGPRNLSFQPQPVGPAGGRVLYVADDGKQGILHVVSVKSGADNELLTTAAIVAAMALDPSGTTAYVVLLDRTTGVFVSVEAVATAGGEARPIMTAPDAVTLLGNYQGLAVSTDGRWVALATCRSSDCDLVAAAVGGGAVQRWPGFGADEHIVGIMGDLLIGSSSPCALAICDGFVVDVRTGVRWPLGGAGDIFDPKQLIAGPHGPLVLGQLDDYKAGRWQVEALDLTDRTRSMIFAATYTPIDFEVALAEWQQTELPPGWFLIYRNSTGAPSHPPDFSAGTIGGKAEITLPIMTIPKR